MSAKAPTYVSASGTLTARPLSVRFKDYAKSWYLMVFLFWQTLLLPMIHHPAFADPNSRPAAKGSGAAPRGGGGGGAGGGGRGPGGGGSGSWGGGGGSGGGGGRGGGGGGGGGFMSMRDIRGGGTVDSCRATCG